MTIDQFSELTGITVSISDVPKYTASILSTRLLLEQLLGYTLDESKVDENEWVGHTPTFAYRVFNCDRADDSIWVDPFNTLHKVYAIYSNNESEILNDSQIEYYLSNGWTRYVGLHNCFKMITNCLCSPVKIAVDADWIGKDCFPDEIMLTWATLASEFADESRNIRSETIGSHRYERFGSDSEASQREMAVINKYRQRLVRFAGPRGLLITMPV